MRKSLCLFLALLLIVASFTGCGGTQPQQTTKDPSDTSQTTEPTTADPYNLANSSGWTDEQWLAYEKQLDFGGYSFKLSIDTSERTPYATDGGADPQSEVYDRWREELRKLEEDIGVNIQYVTGLSGDSAKYMSYIMSSLSPADFFEIKTHTWFPLLSINGLVKFNSDVIKNAGLDVYNEKLLYQDYTHAWDINGDTYAIRYASEFCMPEAGWVLYYNKDLVIEAGVDDICQVVRDGDWTFDYFYELAGRIIKDTDSDGVVDIWGVATGYLGYGEEVLLTGGKIVDWVDGKLTSMIGSTESIEAFSFMDRISESGYIVQNKTGANATYSEGHIMFKEGKVGLLWSEMNKSNPRRQGNSDLYNAEISYGVLPTPKANKDSDYANVLGGVRFDVMLISNPDKAKSAAIYAAFARRQNNVNIETDIADYLQDSDDEDSLDMLTNYIFSKPVANWSWCSEEHNDLYRSSVVYRIHNEGVSIAEIIAGAKPGLQSVLDKLYIG